MKSSNGGQGSGIFRGRTLGGSNPDSNKAGDRSSGHTSEALLKELVVRLQDHADSLRRDIRRLQRALVEINGAIALSLDRIERLRANTERLHAIFGDPHHSQGDKDKPRKDRRLGAERRSGVERRRARSEASGLLRWIEGTSLDRRKVPDRRMAEDRRRSDSIQKPDRLLVTAACEWQPSGNIISLADYRRSREAAPVKGQP